jgi:hypothetical protein
MSTGRSRRANLEDAARAKEGDIEYLEKVELPHQKRHLIRRSPGQDETNGRQLADYRFNNDAASLHLGEGACESDYRLLGVPVESELNTEGVGQYANHRPAIDERQPGHRMRRRAKVE